MRPGQASGPVTSKDDGARIVDALGSTVSDLTTTQRHVFQDRAAAQLQLFAIRCADMVERIAAREITFLDGVDMLYSAAVWSGLIDNVGDDAVQLVLFAAFSPLQREAQ
jgi:hypothetical protein